MAVRMAAIKRGVQDQPDSHKTSWTWSRKCPEGGHSKKHRIAWCLSFLPVIFCFHVACSYTLNLFCTSWLPQGPVCHDTIWLWFPWLFLVQILWSGPAPLTIPDHRNLQPTLGLAVLGVHAHLGSVSCSLEGRSCGPCTRICDLRIGKWCHSMTFLVLPR